MTQASICTIGDEILIGQIVDTNSSHISKALNSLGIKVSRMVSIADDHDCIIASLTEELKANDIVVVTGGLGPTKDDITKKALFDLSGSTSVRRDEEQLSTLDAAYLISTAQNNPLDQTLRFSLSFDLDGLRDLFRR